MKTFAQKLRTLRESMRLSQVDVASGVGVAQTQVSRWEKGTGRGPTLGEAMRLSELLDVPLRYLADDRLDVAPEPDVRPDERPLIILIRAMGIEEATRRLASIGTSEDATWGRRSDPPPPPKTTKRAR